jgi:hypothetical protein
VTSRLDALVLVLLVGCGLLPMLRLARTRRQLLARLPLAYAVGLAATGIFSAELALIHVPAGRPALAVLAAVTLVLGLPGLPAGEPVRLRRPRAADIPTAIVLGLIAAIGVQAARVASVKPLVEPDEWQIWATRARALYLFGSPAAPVFTDPSYPGLRQPILLPALEALDFDFRGGVDETLVHLQLLLFAVAFAGGAWILLRRVAGPGLLAVSLLAVFAAPGYFDALLSNRAAMPLAVFVALGLASLAAWLRTGEGGLLAGAALFLAAATLTAGEGEALVLAAFVAAAAVSRRPQLRPLATAAVVVAAVDLSWRLWMRAEGVGGPSPHPGVTRLWKEMWDLGSWSWLPALVLLGLAGGLALRHFRRVLFVAAWLGLSLAGLLFLGSSSLPGSPVTVAGLLVGGTLLVPFLLRDAPLPEDAPVPARRFDPLVSLQRLGHTYLPHRTPETVGATAPADGFPWRRPRRELLLLALLAAAALTPVFAVGAQDVSRVCLTKALVHLRLSNDACFNDQYGRDKSVYGGHTYSDKAPGMSLLEIPAVVIARIPDPQSWPYESVRLWVARAFSSGLALILCAFLVGRMSEGLAPGYGGISMIAFGLGTLVAPFGAANFEHGTAGLLGLAAFALAWRRRTGWAGLAAGGAILVAYEAALIAAVVAVYVLATQGLRPTLRFLAGTLQGVVLLGAYNWAAFDAPWHFSYRYKSEEFAQQQSSGFFGIHPPYAHAVHLLFLGPGGLLVISPVVVAAAYGLLRLAMTHRAEAIACAAVVAAFALLEAGYFDTYGGFSPGPRFFIPALPFLALGLGPAFAANFRLVSVLTVLSIVPMTVLTLTWANSRPDQGTIWHDIQVFPRQLGSSWIVHSLTSNLLESIGASRGGAATFVAVAAAAAFLLALPVTMKKRQGGPATDSIWGSSQETASASARASADLSTTSTSGPLGGKRG